MVDPSPKIETHMANTRHGKPEHVTCKLQGSWNWWPRQLERRGPHRGADQRPIRPRDLAWDAAAMMQGHGQRLHSPVLFCFTPHTHAHCPSIAYWITSNHSIKVTWRSSIRGLNRATGRWITEAVLLLFMGSFKTRCLKCYDCVNSLNLWLRSGCVTTAGESTVINLHQTQVFFCNRIPFSSQEFTCFDGFILLWYMQQLQKMSFIYVRSLLKYVLYIYKSIWISMSVHKI